MAAKKHHTDGRDVAEATRAAVMHDTVIATPKSTSFLRLDTRNGRDTATR